VTLWNSFVYLSDVVEWYDISSVTVCVVGKAYFLIKFYHWLSFKLALRYGYGVYMYILFGILSNIQ